jgi:hypothetical protein
MSAARRQLATQPRSDNHGMGHILRQGTDKSAVAG